jgi:hypothetical protein
LRADDPFLPSPKRVEPVPPVSGKHVATGTVAGVIPQKDVLTIEEAKIIFDWMKNQGDIPFRYTEDGCYARAHLMIKRMQAMGLNPGKIWVMATVNHVFVSTPYGTKMVNGVKGELWGYHCAPTVKVRLADGKVQTCVIDPSLCSTPVLAGTWENLFVPVNKTTDGTVVPVEGTRPYFTETAFGESPVLPNGTRNPGTGYVPWNEDKVENVDVSAVAVCKLYKSKEPAPLTPAPVKP